MVLALNFQNFDVKNSIIKNPEQYHLIFYYLNFIIINDCLKYHQKVLSARPCLTYKNFQEYKKIHYLKIIT